MKSKIFTRLVMIVSVVTLLSGATVVASCQSDAETQMQTCAKGFSDTYFNWQYHRSVPYCTSESRQWLSYMASQVNSEDVEALRSAAEGATTEIADMDYNESDTVASVVVTVRNYLEMDSLGKAGQHRDEARFSIPMVMRQGKWKVSLSAPLRALKD